MGIIEKGLQIWGSIVKHMTVNVSTIQARAELKQLVSALSLGNAAIQEKLRDVLPPGCNHENIQGTWKRSPIQVEPPKSWRVDPFTVSQCCMRRSTAGRKPLAARPEQPKAAQVAGACFQIRIRRSDCREVEPFWRVLRQNLTIWTGTRDGSPTLYNAEKLRKSPQGIRLV